MADRQRTEAGTFAETVTLEDVLEIFDEVRGPVVTSSDVAEHLECTTEAARQKLTRLYDRGEVDKRKTGRTVVYWWANDTRDESDAGDTDARGADVDATHSSREPSTPAADGSRALTDPALADLEFPAGRDREECLAAIDAARAYLREHGPAPMREIVAEVLPEHPLGYEVPTLEEGDRYRGAWWRRIVKPGLEALADVEKPPQGGSDWRYTGEP